MSFGERLRLLRKKNNITQYKLSQILNLGESTISFYESGKREPDYKILKKIADYFNVSVDYLLGRTDNPTPSGREAAKEIEQAIQDDDELLEFWYELSQREDLQLMFKQARELKPESIKKIIEVIKMIEDKEAGE